MVLVIVLRVLNCPRHTIQRAPSGGSSALSSDRAIGSPQGHRDCDLVESEFKFNNGHTRYGDRTRSPWSESRRTLVERMIGSLRPRMTVGMAILATKKGEQTTQQR